MKKNLISASIGLGLMTLAGTSNANSLTFNEGQGLDFYQFFSVTLPVASTGVSLKVSGPAAHFSTLSFSFNSGAPFLATHPSTPGGSMVWQAYGYFPGLSGGQTYQLKVSGHTLDTISPLGYGTFTVQALGAVVAVPEPESYAMLLAGLGLLGVVARRRARAAS
jgi:hypothetical protein